MELMIDWGGVVFLKTMIDGRDVTGGGGKVVELIDIYECGSSE